MDGAADASDSSHPRARATRATTTTTTRETMKRARGVARANANDGPFAVEEARGTLVTLAREIKRERGDGGERSISREARRAGSRRAIEAIEKRDEEEEEEEKTKWTTFGVRADDGSTARLSYAFSNVVDGASATLALKMDAVDARGATGTICGCTGACARKMEASGVRRRETLVRVPEGSRAPDGKSCESAFRASGGDAQTLELALETRGGDVRAVMCLPRTSDCRVWFKRDGGDISIEIPNGGLRGTSTKERARSAGAAARLRRPSGARRRREFAALNQWRGQEVKLQTHKGGNNERNVRWNTDNLAEVARRRVVEGDRDSRRRGDKSFKRLKISSVKTAPTWTHWRTPPCTCSGSPSAPSRAWRTGRTIVRTIRGIHALERMFARHRGGGTRGERYRERWRSPSRARTASAHSSSSPSSPGVHRRVHAERAADAHSRHRARQGRQGRKVPRRSTRDQAHDSKQASPVRGTGRFGRHRSDVGQVDGARDGLSGGVRQRVQNILQRAQGVLQPSSVTDRIDRIANENGAPGRAAESSKTFLAAKAKVDALPASDRIGDQVTMSASVECLLAIHVAYAWLLPHGARVSR